MPDLYLLPVVWELLTLMPSCSLASEHRVPNQSPFLAATTLIQLLVTFSPVAMTLWAMRQASGRGRAKLYCGDLVSARRDLWLESLLLHTLGEA